MKDNRIPEKKCEWFMNCKNVAVRTTNHPILGQLNTCQRCHEFATMREARSPQTDQRKQAMTSKKRKPIHGSVISGTLNANELLTAFLAELRRLRGAVPKEIMRDLDAVNRKEMRPEEVVDKLMDEINLFAPPYWTFSAHDGDGSDFGWWVDGSIEDFDGLRVKDLSEVPSSYTGEILLTNDHGNQTLYSKRPYSIKELWSIV